MQTVTLNAERIFFGAWLGIQNVTYSTNTIAKANEIPEYLSLGETSVFGINLPDEQAVRNAALDPFGDVKKGIRVVRVEIREFLINGEPARFELIEGTQPFDLDAKVRVISGLFPGRVFHGSRPFIKLSCLVSEDHYDEAAFLRMLDSIK